MSYEIEPRQPGSLDLHGDPLPCYNSRNDFPEDIQKMSRLLFSPVLNENDADNNNQPRRAVENRHPGR